MYTYVHIVHVCVYFIYIYIWMDIFGQIELSDLLKSQNSFDVELSLEAPSPHWHWFHLRTFGQHLPTLPFPRLHRHGGFIFSSAPSELWKRSQATPWAAFCSQEGRVCRRGGSAVPVSDRIQNPSETHHHPFGLWWQLAVSDWSHPPRMPHRLLEAGVRGTCPPPLHT